jgi:hypothetical protein
MSLDIENSVGAIMPDGSESPNDFNDVLFIQYLLNKSGVLAEPLPLDGKPTPELNQAIMDFENAEDTVPDIDGRIDPFDEAWVALNNTPLPDFEGVADRQEWRMIIQRPSPEWNFTRGRFKTLRDAGVDLSFHPTDAAWLNDVIKNRLILALAVLLDPEIEPAPTFGVHPADWHHVHFGFWSRQENVSVSQAALAWKTAALDQVHEIQKLRTLHHNDLLTFRRLLTDLMRGSAIQGLLNTYAQSPEAVMVHHTFEFEDWRPPMENTDPRRHWMVTAADEILIPPFRSPEGLDAADRTGEFICENSLQLCMLIDEFGVIHPLLGIPHDLKIYSGFEIIIEAPPPGPPLHE